MITQWDEDYQQTKRLKRSGAPLESPFRETAAWIAAEYGVRVLNVLYDIVAPDDGGKHAATPREAAKDCDFVMMRVGNDDDVRSVVYGESGALAGMRKGAILVDHTTASATVGTASLIQLLLKDQKGAEVRPRSTASREGRANLCAANRRRRP